MTCKTLEAEILSVSDMKRIHCCSQAILEQQGVRIEHEQALRSLADAGADVDFQKKLVCFPAELVERSLANVPKTIRLAGRDPEFDRELNAESDFLVRCLSGPGLVPQDRGPGFRKATLQDQQKIAIIADGLPSIECSGMLSLQDVPGETADLFAAKSLLEHSRKHFMSLSLGSKNMRYLVEMQLAVRGTRQAMIQRPLFHGLICPISPLYYPADEIEKVKAWAEHRLPLVVAVEIMLGATAPVSLAGALVQGNAEVLAAMALVQTLYPETPMFYYCFPSLTDMRSGKTRSGGPENMLLVAALSRLGTRLYGLPTECPGLVADGADPGAVMFEKGYGAAVAALSGANLLSGAGGLNRETAISLKQLVIDDEIIAYTRRLSSGFRINLETIGLEAVQRVGPRGNFLADEHTWAHFRNEIRFYPSLLDSGGALDPALEQDGLLARAGEKLEQMLKNHDELSLDRSVVRDLEGILKSAVRDIAGT